MRTFAAANADRERDRYAGNAQLDTMTKAGAEALLSQSQPYMLAKQSLAILAERAMPLEALPASERVILALQTLKLVSIKRRIVSLTPTGAKMAAKKMEGA